MTFMQFIFLHFGHSESLNRCTCIAEINIWMQLNMLKLNNDMTEVISIDSNNSFNSFSTVSVRVGDALVISGQSGCILTAD